MQLSVSYIHLLHMKSYGSNTFSHVSMMFYDFTIFYLIAGDAGIFSVNPTTGSIKLNQGLDYDTLTPPRQYTLNVRATDGGGSQVGGDSV